MRGRRCFDASFRRAGAAALSLFVLAGAPRSAFGYCLERTCSAGECTVDEQGCSTSGLPLQWPSRCVGYSFNPSFESLPVEEVRAAMTAAFATWNAVQCPGGRASIEFVPLDDVECATPEFVQDGGNANAVIFADEWPHPNSEIERPVLTFDLDTGAIFDADVEINLDGVGVTVDGSGLDLQSLLTHAAGHMLGLAHSSDPAATMLNAIEPGNIEGRTLSEDDIAAVCELYPPDRAARCAPEPVRGLSSCPGSEEPIVEDAGEGERRIEGCGCRVAGRGHGDASAAWLTAPVVFAIGLLARRRRRRSRG